MCRRASAATPVTQGAWGRSLMAIHDWGLSDGDNIYLALCRSWICIPQEMLTLRVVGPCCVSVHGTQSHMYMYCACEHTEGGWGRYTQFWPNQTVIRLSTAGDGSRTDHYESILQRFGSTICRANLCAPWINWCWVLMLWLLMTCHCLLSDGVVDKELVATPTGGDVPRPKSTLMAIIVKATKQKKPHLSTIFLLLKCISPSPSHTIYVPKILAKSHK